MILPQIFFSEFAYSRSMEIILFFIVNIANFAYAYIITSVLLAVFMHKVTIARMFCYVLILVLFQSICVYVPYAITGFQGLGRFLYFVSTPNPLISFLQIYLCTKLFKMPKHRTTNMMLCFYLFSLFLLSLSRVFNFSVFQQIGDRYNYMIDAGSALTGAFINVILYNVLIRVFKRESIIISLTDNVFAKPTARNFVFIAFLEFLAYGLVVFAQLHQRYDSFAMLLISVILFLAIAVTILRLMHSADQINLQNKAAHINTLNKVIADFRAVKHDFYNILGTYSGYIALEDTQGMKQYHEKLMKSTVAAGDQLDIATLMHQNPSLSSLLIQKSEQAEKLHIVMNTALHCSIDDIKIDNFDLCRIIANLLDNAIEAAILTDQPNVSFSIEQKKNGDKLIVITNPVHEEVDVSKIATLGYTTKENHSGIGLSQVREITSKYKNCVIHFSCYDMQFSSFVEIKES